MMPSKAATYRPRQLAPLAAVTNVSVSVFRDEFEYLAIDEPPALRLEEVGNPE